MAIEFIKKMMEDTPSIKPPEYVKGNLSYFSRLDFEHTINQINVLTDHQLFDFIKTNLDYIQSCIMNRDPIYIYMQVLCEHKFSSKLCN